MKPRSNLLELEPGRIWLSALYSYRMALTLAERDFVGLGRHSAGDIRVNKTGIQGQIDLCHLDGCV